MGGKCISLGVGRWGRRGWAFGGGWCTTGRRLSCHRQEAGVDGVLRAAGWGGVHCRRGCMESWHAMGRGLREDGAPQVEGWRKDGVLWVEGGVLWEGGRQKASHRRDGTG